MRLLLHRLFEQRSHPGQILEFIHHVAVSAAIVSGIFANLVIVIFQAAADGMADGPIGLRQLAPQQWYHVVAQVAAFQLVKQVGPFLQGFLAFPVEVMPHIDTLNTFDGVIQASLANVGRNAQHGKMRPRRAPEVMHSEGGNLFQHRADVLRQ